MDDEERWAYFVWCCDLDLRRQLTDILVSCYVATGMHEGARRKFEGDVIFPRIENVLRTVYSAVTKAKEGHY